MVRDISYVLLVGGVQKLQFLCVQTMDSPSKTVIKNPRYNI